ncbi:hypothetical protein [Pseudomonas sp. 460]|uniref:hypothetical protein n=1 Tax=Pseudomonas sp. 460 TaxID=2485142 RepID=UPI0010526F10|nr:hypothetical protein [Pseudomonas sp. 460]TCV51616.1 hypothetical protein EDB99_107282 [Pseudomonas sp. 460]
MTDLLTKLKSLNKEQGAKVLLYCDLRGMQRDLVVRGAWGLPFLGLAMIVLTSLGRSDNSLLAPYLDWMGIGICFVALLYGGISLFMVWSIRATRHSLSEMGVRPELVEQLDALPSKSLARRRVEQ